MSPGLLGSLAARPLTQWAPEEVATTPRGLQVSRSVPPDYPLSTHGLPMDSTQAFQRTRHMGRGSPR